MRRQSVLLFVLAVVLLPLISQSVQAQSLAPTPGGTSTGGSARSILPSQGQVGQEVASLRTQTSRTYVSHGVYSRQISPGPVNYQDAQGAWQPIDNTLVPSDAAGYAYTNKANVYRADFPADLSAKPIRIQLQMDWIQFAPVGTSAATSASTMAGNTITYTQPGYHLTYTTGNDVVKEAIVLDGPSSPSSLTFSLTTSPGITAQSNAGGGIDFVNAGGAVQFGFLPPTINDAAGISTTVSHAVSMTLGQDSGGGLQVTVAADPKWLSDPGRTWPLTIDPSVSAHPTREFQGATQDCTLVSGTSAYTSYCVANPDLNVGYDATRARSNRPLLQFDTSSFLPTTEILSAELDVYLWNSSNMTTQTMNVDLYGVTHSWTNAATWNAYDGVNSWSTPGGDYSSTLASTALIQQGASNWTSWSPTALVQSWVDGTVPNDGMLLKSHDETTSNWLQFSSSDAPSSSNWPTLWVTYIPRLGTDQVYPLAGAAGVAVNTANGNLVVHATDLAMQGVGLPLVVDRSYNSQCATPVIAGANSLGLTAASSQPDRMSGSSVSATVQWSTPMGRGRNMSSIEPASTATARRLALTPRWWRMGRSTTTSPSMRAVRWMCSMGVATCSHKPTGPGTRSPTPTPGCRNN